MGWALWQAGEAATCVEEVATCVAVVGDGMVGMGFIAGWRKVRERYFA